MNVTLTNQNRNFLYIVFPPLEMQSNWHNSTCEMLMYMIVPHTFIYAVHNYNVFLSLLAVVMYIDPDYNQSQ